MHKYVNSILLLKLDVELFYQLYKQLNSWGHWFQIHIHRGHEMKKEVMKWLMGEQTKHSPATQIDIYFFWLSENNG